MGSRPGWILFRDLQGIDMSKDEAGALRVDDLRALLRLINALHEMPPDPLIRKQFLLKELCALSRAKVGICAITHLAQPLRSLSPVPVVYTGVRGEAEAGILQRYYQTGEPSDPFRAGMIKLMVKKGPCLRTFSQDQIVSSTVWRKCEYVEQVRRPAGLGHCICSMLPLSGTKLVGELVLSRASSDRRPFSDRERNLLDVFHGEAAWIYQADVPFGSPDILSLTPRQRQTLQYLLAGHSEKQIASMLKLSRNTVHHYVKALHRHFKVSSRSELLARWVRSV